MPVPDLFPGVPDTHLLTTCPTVDTPDGPLPLRDWLRHFAGADAWSQVVSRFYTRAAADPDIAGYFTRVDIDQLQRHFLAALMIVTGQGVTVGVVRRMHTAHATVRNRHRRADHRHHLEHGHRRPGGCPRRAGYTTGHPGRAGHHPGPDPRRHRHRTGGAGPVNAYLDQAVYALLTPARGVIDRHGNNGAHNCRSCGLPWPCFELGTAIGALDLVLRVHVAARTTPRPPRRDHADRRAADHRPANPTASHARPATRLPRHTGQ